MKIQTSKKDIFSSILKSIFITGSSLILIPFLLLLPDLELGIYYVFIGLATIVNLFDFGFTASFSRYITYVWSGAVDLVKLKNSSEKEINEKLLMQIVLVSRKIYFFISVISLFLLSTLGTYYVFKVSNGLVFIKVLFSWIFYLAGIALNLYFNYYSTLLRGIGKISQYNNAFSISKIIQVFFSIIFLFFNLTYFGLAISYFISVLAFRLLISKELSKYTYLLNHKINLNGYLNAEFRVIFSTIWKSTWKEGIISLSSYILVQGGTIIVSIFLSLSETAVYGLILQITSAVALISSSLSDAFQPSMQSSFALNDTNSQKKELSVLILSFVILYFIGFLFLILFGIDILFLISSSITLPLMPLLLMGLYQFILKIRNSYASYFSSTNRLNYYSSFLWSSILSLILMIVSVYLLNLGLIGIMISQILSQIVFNFWYWSYKTHKELKLSIKNMITYFFSFIKDNLNIKLRNSEINKK